MRKSNYLFPVLAIGLTAVSCQDYDAGVTDDTFKKKEYAENFKSVFGTPDPNQDWSMATTITVNVNVVGANGGSLRLLTSHPQIKGCQILASKALFSDDFSFEFDAVKGTERVYAEVIRSDGRQIIGSYFNVSNGTISVKNIHFGTRAGSFSIGNYVDSKSKDEGAEDGSLMFTGCNGYMLPNPITFKDGKSRTDFLTTASCEYPLLTMEGNYNYVTNLSNGGTTITRFYEVNNLETESTGQLPLKELYSLFFQYTSTEIDANGDNIKKNGPFKETEPNCAKYLGVNRIETPQGGYLEKDVVFTTTGGPVELNFIGKGTDYPNDFGYFYYDKNQEEDFMTNGVLDLSKVNKYVFAKDILNNHDYLKWHDAYNPQKQIGWDTEKGCGIFDEQWNYECNNYSQSQFQAAIMKSATDGFDWMMLEGTKFKLAYFGDRGDGSLDFEATTPNYTFPANYLVGFFLIRTDQGIANATHGGAGHLSVSLSSVGETYFNTVPRATTFKHHNNVYMGFEDNTDNDLNDVFFGIYGVDTHDIPDITPDDDAEVPETPKPLKWLVACEDLGGTFDYDFNDIVVGFEKKEISGTDHLFLQPLAAGGTLPSVISYEDYSGSGLGEIHQLLGADPVNGENARYSTIMSKFDANQVDLGECPSGIAEALKKLKINVKNQGTDITVLESSFNDEADATPQMLLLPGGWDWPTEGTKITNVYNDFVQWAQDASYTSWTKKNGAEFINNTWGK